VQIWNRRVTMLLAAAALSCASVSPPRTSWDEPDVTLAALTAAIRESAECGTDDGTLYDAFEDQRIEVDSFALLAAVDYMDAAGVISASRLYWVRYQAESDSMWGLVHLQRSDTAEGWRLEGHFVFDAACYDWGVCCSREPPEIDRAYQFTPYWIAPAHRRYRPAFAQPSHFPAARIGRRFLRDSVYIEAWQAVFGAPPVIDNGL
jgi:hypothetical protein